MTLSEDAVLLSLPQPALREALAGVRVVEATGPEALQPAEREAVRVWVTSGIQPIGAAQMALLPNLGRIVTLGAGYDGVDMTAAGARGIELRTGSGANAHAVADAAIALFLAAARRIVANDTLVRSGGWKGRELRPVRSIGAMAVGIVGLGAIGRATADRLVPFGCEIAWTGPHPKPDAPFAYNPSLQDLAHWADVLIVAAPLSPETHGMIDAEVMAALGPEGILVNVGRGPLVDEDALIDALCAGRLGAAALDVFEDEPTPAERWRDVPNTVLSPHTAGVTYESFTALIQLAADQAKAFLSGG
jgi:lactate dehydrogenase-like 2-hydroxyacid dehydrogenase